MHKYRKIKSRMGKKRIILTERTDESTGKEISEPRNSAVTLSGQGNVDAGTRTEAELRADIEDAWEGMRDFSW